ncbi:MAG: AI-2E family transporter [Verrucomicrobiae bacterium]|jgi:predicted PurR-regulated permease PerM|nr:AI-2E family transporter [Verrucomicrobiae bacterium]
MNKEYPTSFQRRFCWNALTAFAGVVIFSIALGIGWIVFEGIRLFQPVLMPIAIASILAYLLNPVVTWLCRYHLPRTISVIAVFAVFTLFLVGIVFWIAPSLQRQGSSFIKNLPAYSQHVQNLVGTSATLINHFMESTQSHNMEVPLTQLDKIHDYTVNLLNEGITWLQQKIPTIVEALGHLVKSSIGGVFGIFGMLVSLILVPILLFFFLLESPSIKEYWSDYLPLPPSRFKEEVVSFLLEINNTIIFFFRGQLMVSLVDGALIAVALMIFVHLDFAALLGLMVGILGLIPYAGIILCWIPAVIIAAAQFGDWWHPLLVTIIFLVANNVDGIFISPKIVGQSVGLHPIVVILSVITWSIVLGGLLGALLAVPLTASLIVILRRYVWGKIAFEKQL